MDPIASAAAVNLLTQQLNVGQLSPADLEFLSAGRAAP